MTKTAAQLDAEIAEALAGEHDYVVIDRRGGHRTIYRPFETRKDAEYAAYFTKPVAERDSHPPNIYFMRGVQRYDAEEIKTFQHYPQEYDFKSFKLRRGPPPMHPSWRKFDAEFRTYLRDNDYDLYQRIMRR